MELVEEFWLPPALSAQEQLTGGAAAASSSSSAPTPQAPGGAAVASPGTAAAALVETAAPAAAADVGSAMEIDDIEALCQLIDDHGQGPNKGSDPGDIDELLGALAPATPLSSRLSPRLSPSSLPGGLPEGLAMDLPEPTLALPLEVACTILPFTTIAKFHLRCEVDMRKVAFGIRHAEYNPRKHSSITVRLLDPRATAMVRASGVVTITGVTDQEQLKAAAKKVTRLIQRTGHDQAKFSGYAVCSVLAKATMDFPVRLDHLAAKYRRNALYEPELYCGCVFRTQRPRCTFLLTSGGKVMVSGFKSMEDVIDAVRRIYPILHEFKT